MGGTVCKEEVKEEKRRSVGREDSLTSADRIRRFTVKQFGFNVLSLARRGLKVGDDERSLLTLTREHILIFLSVLLPFRLLTMYYIIYIMVTLYCNTFCIMPPLPSGLVFAHCVGYKMLLSVRYVLPFLLLWCITLFCYCKKCISSLWGE